MGGTKYMIQAKTKTELRKKFSRESREAREAGLYPDWKYDPDLVRKTKSGYQIPFSAHT